MAVSGIQHTGGLMAAREAAEQRERLAASARSHDGRRLLLSLCLDALQVILLARLLGWFPDALVTRLLQEVVR